MEVVYNWGNDCLWFVDDNYGLGDKVQCQNMSNCAIFNIRVDICDVLYPNRLTFSIWGIYLVLQPLILVFTMTTTKHKFRFFNCYDFSLVIQPYISVLTKENQDRVPTLYWLPKLHKLLLILVLVRQQNFRNC